MLPDNTEQGHSNRGGLCVAYSLFGWTYSISSIALFKLSHKVLAITSAPAGEA